MADDAKMADFSRGADVDLKGSNWTPPGRYRPSGAPRWVALVLIAFMHAAGFVALRHIAPNAIKHARSAPLVVDLLPLEPPPSTQQPEPVALPTKQETPSLPARQRIVVPASIVKIISSPAPPEITQRADLAPAPVEGTDEPQASQRASEPMVNLNTRLLSANPPRYPVESRRRREVGTVILLVVVDEQGRVAAISVATSSGADRLDKAALGAVRRWRWSPTLIDGQPAQVKGLVRIPFQLKENA